MRRGSLFVGIDIGSVSANTVVVSAGGGGLEVLEEKYTRTRGEPLETALAILSDIIDRHGKEAIAFVATTGSGGKLITPLIGGEFTNEVIAQAKATVHFHPEARTVIEMGGQDAKLILLEEAGLEEAGPEDVVGEEGGPDGSPDASSKARPKIRIEDFQMNSVCAAGTGSFLDQQATRLGFSIEEFAEISLKSKNPPRVAGRCSVFAKSDMIHLQQTATPDYDIVAGLCYAVARNFKATIGKGKDFKTPIAFQGGVAANAGVRKAFKEVLELPEGDYIVPKHFASMGAIGAVLATIEKAETSSNYVPVVFKGTGDLEEFIGSEREQERALDKLEGPARHPSFNETSIGYRLDPENPTDAYLGLDIGSTSTNVVLVDRDGVLITKRYLKTAGRPLEAVRKGLCEVSGECGEAVRIVGAGSTGSGRYLIGDFVGADVIRNEITAQARAAAAIDPAVDTIFEIGGQDSKYIALNGGVVVDFEMNKVCAAGTGSFLEEQAERLGINIKEEFSDMALASPAPAPMGDRCTVFIESDMVHHQSRGIDRGGLVSGLSYSIVHNYLNRVVGDRRIGERIFFQGGTAANLGVVAAFEKITGKKVTVPTHHDVTGAIGVALLAAEEMAEGEATRFKGFGVGSRKYSVDSFECDDCSNICDIKQVTMEGEEPLYYGGRCEKYDVNMAAAKENPLPDLFKEREKMLFAAYRGKAPGGAPVIGIPRILMVYDMYPFWKALLTELGFRTRLSAPTNKAIISEGLERVVAETCFPVKVAHGHVQDLIDKGVKTIFMPSIINMPPAKPGHRNTILCPYVQTMPYLSEAAFDFGGEGVTLLKPVIHFNQSERGIRKEFYAFAETLGKSSREIDRALRVAKATQAAFKKRLVTRGKEVLDGLGAEEKALVMVGRPYNTTDPGMNLDLPEKLRQMGTLAIPFDMLPVDDEIDDVIAEEMYWKSGQRILAVSKLIKDDPRLFSVYITNFGCGPDSYISHFYKDTSNGKPFLQLEIDEHSADAGAITRCEAYLDSLRNVGLRRGSPDKVHRPTVMTEIRKKIYVPYLADGAYGLAAAFEACGVEAEVIAHPDADTLKIGREYTSGRECYPGILTTGDMIKVTRRPDFDRERSAFFMPSGSGPCRFGQYNRYHRLILDELGFTDVPVYAPNQDETLYKELNMVEGNFSRLGWWGIAAVDLLEKRLRETRPYEKVAGTTDKVYWEWVHRVCDAVRARRFPGQELRDAKKAFLEIDVDESGSRPVIGIVGEIYVRSNHFSNEDLVRQLEALGAEARIPPVGEWIYYTNYSSKKRNWHHRGYADWARAVLHDFVQRMDEHKMENLFDGDLRGGHEPPIKTIIEKAAPYIHESFEGETVLSVGKVLDYVQKGAHGIINVMPFTCMHGTIVSGVLKSVKKDDPSGVPYLNMVYEGIEDTNSETRLEAFVHQARESMERRQ